MITMRPLKGFCGYMSLSMGVLVAIACSLIQASILLAAISSEKALVVGHVVVEPGTQMLIGSMTVVGVPLSILAGFGTLYQIAFEVWGFYYYAVASFANDTMWMLRFLLSGDICTTVAPQEVLRRGPLFICCTINALVVFYAVVVSVFRLYLIFVVWSQAKTLSEHDAAQTRMRTTLPAPYTKQSLESGAPTASYGYKTNYDSTGFGGTGYGPAGDYMISF
mmetsp:Transcript_148050/g.260988  ORF Transcript_148050/g.260988 Transcript_148050/m.260988 type:complete len:221 (+) Transcript_148050:129-791(+)